MHRLGVPIAAALLVAASTANATVPDTCWASPELQAARVHDLQTMLMVGSLQCSEVSSDAAVTSYNQFVRQTRDQLRDYNNVLKARFMRLHGVREGQNAYDTFTTSMANDHSSRARSKNFCSTVVSLAQTATAASQDDLEALAETISNRPIGVVEVCTDTDAVATPVMATASQPPETPAPETTVAAHQVTSTAAVAPPSAAPADEQASAAEALKAAALAVQAAAAALETSAGGGQQPTEVTATDAVAAEAPTEPKAE